MCRCRPDIRQPWCDNCKPNKLVTVNETENIEDCFNYLASLCESNKRCITGEVEGAPSFWTSIEHWIEEGRKALAGDKPTWGVTCTGCVDEGRGTLSDRLCAECGPPEWKCYKKSEFTGSILDADVTSKEVMDHIRCKSVENGHENDSFRAGYFACLIDVKEELKDERGVDG